MDDVKYVNILNKFATALNDDYQWCIKTQIILENDNKLTDPATIGFLKGVEYVTSQLLDILESDPLPPTREPDFCYSAEDLPEELEPADYITGGNEDGNNK